jgi:hypothetical protein
LWLMWLFFKKKSLFTYHHFPAFIGHEHSDH